jgi:hypothetical protein
MYYDVLRQYTGETLFPSFCLFTSGITLALFLLYSDCFDQIDLSFVVICTDDLYLGFCLMLLTVRNPRIVALLNKSTINVMLITDADY